MLTLPIPMIVALILGFLLLRAWRDGGRPVPFLLLIGACAAQTLLVAAVQHYGLTWLRPVQPVLATTVPPLAWIAFQTAGLRAPDLRRDAVHLAGPVVTATAFAVAPVWLDVIIPAIYVGYAAAILIGLRRSAGDLPLARLETGGQPALIWLALAFALLVSAISDVLIALALSTGREALMPLLVSLFSSLALLAVGVLGLSRNAIGTPEPPAPDRPPVEASEADAALVARLDRLLTDERLYLEPDLTLARLARRLHVPAKQLSAAINRTTGQNVSRHVNGWRIRHACTRLAAGASVTEAIYASGFNTKSNFNREFARVTGRTPTDWQAGRP